MQAFQLGREVVMSTTPIITQSSSKGNQTKWRRHGVWYKEDRFGYEGLSECVCSDLLSILGFPHVKYYPCFFTDTGHRGCYSYNFVKNQKEITLAAILKKEVKPIKKYTSLSTAGKIDFICELLSNRIDKGELRWYLGRILNFDELVLNDDRHLNNIEFFETNGKLLPVPIFDNGGALLSDTTVNGYPFGYPIAELIRSVKSKPFSTTFSKQTQCLPMSLCMPVGAAIACTRKYANFYSKEVIQRVFAILRHRCQDIQKYVCCSVGFSAWTFDGVHFSSTHCSGAKYVDVYPPTDRFMLLAGSTVDTCIQACTEPRTLFDAVVFPNGNIVVVSDRCKQFIGGLLNG